MGRYINLYSVELLNRNEIIGAVTKYEVEDEINTYMKNRGH